MSRPRSRRPWFFSSSSWSASACSLSYEVADGGRHRARWWAWRSWLGSWPSYPSGCAAIC